MHPDMNAEERAAAIAVAGTLVTAALLLYGMKMLGFRFVIGVGE